MFFRYLDPLLRPFRRARNQAVQVKQVGGNMRVDAKRVKNVGRMGKGYANQAAGVKNKVPGMKGGGAPGAPAPMPGGSGAPGPAGGPPPPQPGGGGMVPVGGPPQAAQSGQPQGANPNIVRGGFLKMKRLCAVCGQKMHKSWDHCPYCAQAQQSVSMKTQAFMMDQGGVGSGVQLLGWVVPVQGPQRGELFTLSPVSVVGTDPACTVVLHDQYMSAQHAEIKAEGGVWMLRDLGSTNGTYVNDKRVESHELVDNDFVKFGGSLVKFKSL